MAQNNKSTNFMTEEEEDRMLLEAIREYEASQELKKILDDIKESIKQEKKEFDEDIQILSDINDDIQILSDIEELLEDD